MIGFLAHLMARDSSDEDPFDLLVNLYSDHYKLWRYKTSKILQTDDVDDIIHQRCNTPSSILMRLSLPVARMDRTHGAYWSHPVHVPKRMFP